MRICTVEEMRLMDKRASEEFLVPERILMENAALGSCAVIRDTVGTTGRCFFVVCGIGNNGGDGLVVARQLYSMDASVSVCIVGNRGAFKGVSLENLESLLKTGVPVFDYNAAAFTSALQNCDTVIDALFGTGLTRGLEGDFREVAERINQSGTIVISLDIPSGINGNTGAVMGTAVRADYTITFGLPKTGNLLYPGFSYCGKLFITPISFPPCLREVPSVNASASAPAGNKTDTACIRVNLPLPLDERDPAGHKGSFGDLLVIAGAAAYLGAPYFSALSFLKAGGGYSRLAAPASIVPAIAAGAREIVYVPQKETAGKSIAFENADQLLETALKTDMVIIGPGLSLDPETCRLVCFLAENISKPLLIDGDGLSAISRRTDILVKRHEQLHQPTVLTPHPGEMAALTGLPVSKILEDPITAARETAVKLKTIVVLKQAHTLIAYPDGNVFINLSGNSGMATAGSGDVLTGCIAAMHGLGQPFPDAVRTGVFIHGLAGDLVSADIGADGMTATDILNYLSYAGKKYREEYEQVIKNCNGKIISVW